MTRSIWKGPFTEAILIKKLFKAKLKTNVNLNLRKKIRIETVSRNSTINEQFIGQHFGVYNGQFFIPLTITEEMISFKLGEFVPTRKKFSFKKKKLKKKLLQKTLIKKKK